MSARLLSREPLNAVCELYAQAIVKKSESSGKETWWPFRSVPTLLGFVSNTLESIWNTLESRYKINEPDDWRTSDFRIRALGSNIYLLTHQLQQGDRITRRATLWERADSVWLVTYHQGTIV